MAAVTSRENVVCSHVEPVLSFFFINITNLGSS